MAYPDIESVRVDVEETGDGVTSLNHRRRYDERTLQPFDDCHNRLCYNGGVNLQGLVDYMVASQGTTYEATVACQGYEGSPKGKVKRRSCLNHFKVGISITYKPVRNAPPPSDARKSTGRPKGNEGA